jgi:hypothetical protein
MDLPYSIGSDVAVLNGEGVGGYGVRAGGGDSSRLARVVGLANVTASQSEAVPLKNRRDSCSKQMATFRKGDSHRLALRHDVSGTARARRMQSPRSVEQTVWG